MIGNALAYAATACLYLAIGGCAVYEGGLHQPRDYSQDQRSTATREQEGSAQDSSPAAEGSPAVQALLNQARALRDEENYPQAAAALERALRIEPRNPAVYAELAEVMLAQGLPDEAENLARRSNSLSAGDAQLRARNWMTIAAAMRARGDNANADAAERRAQQLRNLKR